MPNHPKRERLSDLFPFGLAPLMMVVIAAATGGWLLLNPVRTSEADIRLWTFVHSHWEAYREALPAYEQSREATVEIQYMVDAALQSRLRSAFWADLDVPDIVEMEIGSAGSFFRGPVEEVGFLDLTPFLERDGLGDRLVATRLSPYRNRGRQFGLPLDIHPVTIAYRRDLFEEHGIDPEELVTWDDFVQAGRRVSGPGQFMIQLSSSNANQFEVFLFQRGGGYFDADGELTMDDATALETLRWYIPLVAGPNRIGGSLGTDQVFTQALESGYFLCLLAPDWLARHVSYIVPGVEGEMALMPLPAFEPGGRRTSTMGGTMIAITKDTDDPELAWELVKYLAYDAERLEARFRETGVLPALRDAWDLPAFHEPDDYYSGQPVGALFAALADEVPPQYASPYVALAKTKMGDVISSCAAFYRRQGEEGFEEFSERRLREAAEEVRRAMTRNPFQ